MQRFQPAIRLSQHVTSPWMRRSGARISTQSSIRNGNLNEQHLEQHHVLDKSNPIHTLRHLLRECTYLPDALARAYLKDHVIRRFRAHAAKVVSSSTPVPQTRQTARLREARKAIYSLRRANAGFISNIKRVLDMTYGRTGRRSREFMEPLKRQIKPSASTPPDKSASDIIEKVLAKHPTIMPALLLEQIPHFSPALEKLYLSQKQQSRVLEKHLQLGKDRGPEIPAENVFRRSLPAKRVKNRAKRWYAEVMAKLLPPLPFHLWTQLQHLAEQGAPKGFLHRRGRRAMCGSENTADGESLLLSEELSLDERRQQSNMRAGGSKRPHRITPRFMQRRWNEVLEHSPRMTQQQSSEQWSVEWSQRERIMKTKNLSRSIKAAIQADE